MLKAMLISLAAMAKVSLSIIIVLTALALVSRLATGYSEATLSASLDEAWFHSGWPYILPNKSAPDSIKFNHWSILII